MLQYLLYFIMIFLNNSAIFEENYNIRQVEWKNKQTLIIMEQRSLVRPYRDDSFRATKFNDRLLVYDIPTKKYSHIVLTAS